MIEWFVANPIAVGIGMVVLVCIDWILTIFQEKERKEHYVKHYESYPVNTIEGNPVLRASVEKRQWLNLKHLVAAIIIGSMVGYLLTIIPKELRIIFLGYFWGLFIIVNTQHLSNLLGYIASRRGIHGKLQMHLRTGHLVQAGRYFSFTCFLFLLALLSG
jgi:hypothetical protein